MKRYGFLLLVLCSMMFFYFSPAKAQTPAQAQERRSGHFTLGVDVGPAFGTIDGTAANIGLSGDYYASDNLSFGPLLQLGFTGDLTQIALSGQLKYTFEVPPASPFRPNVQIGLGFINADHDLGSFRGSKNDTSYIVPVGLGFEYKVQAGFYVSTTALINYTNLDNSDEGHWQNTLNLLFGVRITL
ncbi:MAG TPA: outer membrane beta-barrel protein [Nitrospiria bacterium]|nr:outer membrane beta-barrel protein [Nitrospiria bacterium]